MSIREIQVSVYIFFMSVGQICFVDVIIIDLPIENHDLVEVLLDLRGLWVFRNVYKVLWQAYRGWWAAIIKSLMAAFLGVEAAQPRCVCSLFVPG